MTKRKTRKQPQKISGWGKVAIGAAGLMAIGSVAGQKPKDSAAAEEVKTSAKSTLTKHMQDIRFCESTDNYKSVNKKSPSHTGAFQFADSTWATYKTGYTHAKDAPASVQDQIAMKEYAKNGNSPWLASKPCWSKR